MMAVHFTTIPCKPNRAIIAHIEIKPYFGEIHPCTNKIVFARFEVFRPFLCIFMSGFRIFVRLELWVNVPVAIFFCLYNVEISFTNCGAYKIKRHLPQPQNFNF